MRVLSSLHFEAMFNWLCSELPQSVPLGEINMHFDNLLDDIDAEHFEDEETGLISNLCSALYTVTQKAGHILTKLIPADVRMDKVKENFEERLREVQEDPLGVNATPHDLELIDEYFRLNS
ncbi:MAG: hypothetical protein FD153_1017 [Rhodospirillaceae bacterium]|nr:MAG: hypothetical protein FD153_1017 [Rhodospirillaceae bacterium]